MDCDNHIHQQRPAADGALVSSGGGTSAEIYSQISLPAECLTYHGITISIQLIDSWTAQKYLERNDANRRIRPPVVRQYARDMEVGEWRFKPLAICFDTDGLLGNGQHTLSAIVLSGVPQHVLVAENVPRDVIAKMDRGIQRTVADIATFMGAAFTMRQSSVARIIGFGVSDTEPRSYDELFAIYLKHREVIEAVCGAAPRKKGFSASVLAVCARALYTQDKQKVMRFLEILRTGVVAGVHESAAITLRDFCANRGQTSDSARAETYRKAQTSLQAFLECRPMAKVYGTSIELFPLPSKPAAK